MTKEIYIDLMERTLKAYTPEHIKRYFDDVKQNGLKEHGFPRLTADIGILVSRGKVGHLRSIFIEMMDFCCENIPKVKAANDFSVREIVCCIREIEKSGAVDKAVTEGWKNELSRIEPTKTYNVYAKEPTSKVKNWALFTGVSEYFRKSLGHDVSDEFIDTQIASQLQWLDENKMYKDNEGDTFHPIVYDIVPRGLFVLLLNEGYRGRYYAEIDECLKTAGLLTLKMQSPAGELAFGGRSNQFLHNEAWISAVFEYEAKRYASEGNLALAYEFKSAIKRALKITESWLSKEPIYHVKNRFPLETKFGCEGYAYFDKYMITAASFFYAAYLVCDESIEYPDIPDEAPVAWQTTDCFHKLFLKAGGYGIEVDLAADPHYDANGLGRVHRVGAPTTVCMSVPCPKNPVYNVGEVEPSPLAICSGIVKDGKVTFAIDEGSKNEVISYYTDESAAYGEVKNELENGALLTTSYKVDADGVLVKIKGSEGVACMLPAFFFDGEKYTEIKQSENELCVSYEGYVCRYTVNGEITDTNTVTANRNGHYKKYVAYADKELTVGIKIEKI